MRRRRVDPGKLIRFILVFAFIAALAIAAITSLINLSGRTLKIGLYESSPPLTYVDDKKNISGFEAEYAGLLAEKLGKKPEFKLYRPEEMRDALNSGSIDCVVSTRQSVHDYIMDAFETAPFIAYGVVFVKPPLDATIEGEEDLRGKRAGLIANSDAEQLCDYLLDSYSFNVRLYDVEVQPFQDLLLKKNDVVIADELYARYMQKTNPDDYKVLDVVYGLADYGVRLSRKLTQQSALDIEDAVYALRTDTAAIDLYMRWFGADLSPMN